MVYGFSRPQNNRKRKMIMRRGTKLRKREWCKKRSSLTIRSGDEKERREGDVPVEEIPLDHHQSVIKSLWWSQSSSFRFLEWRGWIMRGWGDLIKDGTEWISRMRNWLSPDKISFSHRTKKNFESKKKKRGRREREGEEKDSLKSLQWLWRWGCW